MTLRERYRAHARTLGRGEDVRRFLAGVLLTTRFHLSSRPISGANDAFARRLASSSDALLALLREDGWAALEADVEHGLAQLAPLAELPRAIDSPDEFRRIYKRWFGVMNPPWSMLAPAPALTIADWPRPSKILVSVGPNIGIGDEIIFFEAVARLARQFPRAELEVSSFNRTVWNLCPVPLRIVEPGDDQLAPYARAHEVARTDPTALVVFVEFASTPIYRHLERVATIPRFVYLDTGARTARVVDQPRERIAEHFERFDGGVYGVLHRLLDKIGLPGTERQPPPVGPRRHPATVFVSPFSSKNYRELDPGWWSAALRSAAAAGGPGSIEAVIFAGINDECRSYAREIARGCDGAPRTTLFGETSVPTIEQTVRAAAAADAVLGLDTFTAHVGVVAPVPCVTIFFGSAWDPWRVRSNHVLNTHIHSQPEVAGRLVARLVGPVALAARQAARTVVELTRAHAAAMAGAGSAAASSGGGGIALGDVIDTIDRLSAAIVSWAAEDPALARDFVDVAPELAGRVRTALVRAIRQDLSSAGAARVLGDGLDTWTESNLFRYARYLTDLAPAAPSEP